MVYLIKVVIGYLCTTIGGEAKYNIPWYIFVIACAAHNNSIVVVGMISKEKVRLKLTTLTSTHFHACRVSTSPFYNWKPVFGDKIAWISIGRGSGALEGLTPPLHLQNQVITQLAKMSIDPKFIELIADVFRQYFSKLC